MPDRHRTKGTTLLSNKAVLRCPDHNLWPDALGTSGIAPKDLSSLVDRLEHAAWQPCDHLRAHYLGGRLGALQCELTATDPYFHAENVPYGPHRVLCEDLPVVLSTLDELAANGQWSDWLSSLYHKFVTPIPAELSLANALIELKGGVKEFVPEMSDLKRSIGSNFLKIKFGIQPFLSDLKHFVGAFGRFKARMKFLQATHRREYIDRRWCVVHDQAPAIRMNSYEFLGPQGPCPPSGFEPGGAQLPEGVNVVPLGGGGPPDPITLHRVLKHPVGTWYLPGDFEARWNCRALISNQLDGMDRLIHQVDAMGACLGLNNPIKIAWNAIPWTWLADWFIDTDRLFDGLEGAPFEGKLALRHAYLSLKYTALGEVWSVCGSSQSCGEATGEPGYLRLKHYKRYDELAVDDNWLSPRLIHPQISDGLSGSQAAILLALLDRRTLAVPNVQRFYNKWNRILGKRG